MDSSELDSAGSVSVPGNISPEAKDQTSAHAGAESLQSAVADAQSISASDDNIPFDGKVSSTDDNNSSPGNVLSSDDNIPSSEDNSDQIPTDSKSALETKSPDACDEETDAKSPAGSPQQSPSSSLSSSPAKNTDLRRNSFQDPILRIRRLKEDNSVLREEIVLLNAMNARYEARQKELKQRVMGMAATNEIMKARLQKIKESQTKSNREKRHQQKVKSVRNELVNHRDRLYKAKEYLHALTQKLEEEQKNMKSLSDKLLIKKMQLLETVDQYNEHEQKIAKLETALREARRQKAEQRKSQSTLSSFWNIVSKQS